MQREIKFPTKTVTVKGLKAELEHTEEVFDHLLKIRSYVREIRGTIGGEESSSTMYALFGSYRIDGENFTKELAAFADTLPAACTFQEIKPYFPKVMELFNKFVYVDDKRQTQEQRNEAAAEQWQAAEQAAREREERENSFGIGTNEMIGRKEGEMFVTLQCYFNDSDMMTDYYCPHASLSKCYALAVVPEGRQTEAKVRQFLNAIPELSKHQWTWHTENYSMGHGNYLKSETIGTCKKRAYDGREEVAYWYEMNFNTYETNLPKSKYFISETPKEASSSEITTGTITANLEIVDYSDKAIAVFGDTKPHKEILKQLGGRFNSHLTHNGVKTAGWIFSRKQEQTVRAALQPTAAKAAAN